VHVYKVLLSPAAFCLLFLDAKLIFWKCEKIFRITEVASRQSPLKQSISKQSYESQSWANTNYCPVCWQVRISRFVCNQVLKLQLHYRSFFHRFFLKWSVAAYVRLKALRWKCSNARDDSSVQFDSRRLNCFHL